MLDPEFWVGLGIVGLIIVSIIESIFFPIPPDLILIPLALADPENALFYALIATVSSAVGAIGGHYIGRTADEHVLRKMVSAERIERVRGIYEKHGTIGIFVAGFSPIPYKLFTILSGMMGYSWKKLFAVSLVSRGIRFFGEGAFIHFFGAEAIAMLDGNFEVWVIVSAVAVLAAYAFILIMRKIWNGEKRT